MKKTLKRLLLVLLVAALLSGAALAAITTADTAVIYNGSAKEIRFQNALVGFLGKDEPDLFPNFKNMMPGDNVTQEILIGTENIGADTVKMYLRVEPTQDADAAAAYEALMNAKNGDGANWVSLTVAQDGKVLAEGDLQEGVLLGTFTNNKTSKLEVTLSIDINAGNELQGITAAVDWVFTAEVVPYVAPYQPSTGIPDADIRYLTTDHVNYIVGYENGTVLPNGQLTRAEAATIFFRLLTEDARETFWASSNGYPDVAADDWFNVAVSTLTKAGILEGYDDGLFHPQRDITRAELAAILARFDATFGKFQPTETFPDTKGHWAESYIAHAAARGWVLGYPDGKFRPDQNISRAETVAMVNRILTRAVDQEGLTGKYLNWTDNYTNSWYYYDMLEAGNYHDYSRSKRPVSQQSYCYENWTALNDPIDWAAMEQQWIRKYS